MTLEDLAAIFDLLDDWEERYRYLIELGRAAAALPESERRIENQVQGCMSRVWLTAAFDAEAGVMRFRAASDAFIVQGLLAVLLRACDGRPPREVAALEATTFLARFGFDRHLSPNRRNGLVAVVARIRAVALAHSTPCRDDGAAL